MTAAHAEATAWRMVARIVKARGPLEYAIGHVILSRPGTYTDAAGPLRIAIDIAEETRGWMVESVVDWREWETRQPTLSEAVRAVGSIEATAADAVEAWVLPLVSRAP